MHMITHRGALGATIVASVAAAVLGCGTARADDEAARLASLLALQPGMTVADVGAGEGQWTVQLASRVGPDGHVFATEVDDSELEEIRERVEEAQLGNVTVLRGDERDTGLAAGCCDGILLRLVYHHFTDPEAMRASIAQALRPNGRLAICDIVPQSGWRELQDVPDRGGHGIPPEELFSEMVADGFSFIERHDRWNGEDDRFCMVFGR